MTRRAQWCEALRVHACSVAMATVGLVLAVLGGCMLQTPCTPLDFSSGVWHHWSFTLSDGDDTSEFESMGAVICCSAECPTVEWSEAKESCDHLKCGGVNVCYDNPCKGVVPIPDPYAGKTCKVGVMQHREHDCG
eukprot:Sspe_Gene.98549::Locus_71950_Transcript_1_1_Confidence_1.000_Length_442::g.98549::m.98549